MALPYFLQLALHGVCEMVAALGIAFWVSQGWSQNPAPFPVNLVRNPLRLWLMIGFGIAPALLALLLSPLLRQLYASAGGRAMGVPIGFGLSVFYGACVGLAASCGAAPENSRQEFRLGAAAAISAVMIVAFYLLSALLWRQFFIHELAAMVAPVVILFTARLLIPADVPMGEEPPALPATAPVRRSLWPPLLIGFLPSALLLGMFTVVVSAQLNGPAGQALMWMSCGASVVCCFTASIMLFTRNTAGAIVGGIVFLLLNAFIGFFFGCCANTLNWGNLH